MSRKKMLVAAGIVCLLGVSCGGDDAGGDAGGGSTTITASDFAFDPGSVTVASGDGIELLNDGEAEHNLTAEDAGLDDDVSAGESVTIDTSDVEAGSYDFICSYHPDQMTGTLEVTD